MEKSLLFHKSNIAHKNTVVKSFQFYYELKLIFWKSIYSKIDNQTKNPNICCRICDKNISLKEFVLHVYYCKEQNKYFKNISKLKSKLKKYKNLLEIYKMKNNNNDFLNDMDNILKAIMQENDFKYLNIDNKNIDFLQILMNILEIEIKKANDYYEKYPEKLKIISTLITLTNLLYIIVRKKVCKIYQKEEKDELINILGNV